MPKGRTPTDALRPLQLEPKASPRLWGGSRLPTLVPGFAGLELEEPIGEAWLVYAENRVVAGRYRGRTLQEVADELGEALLGRRSLERYGSKVPLLAKFIDAADELSIQVHPDDAYAREREAASGHLGKSEAWYILEAEPGARVVWGLKREVSRAEVQRAAEAGELEPLLNSVPVAPGEVIYNPPGTLHAIGAGILLFEIQQSSDLTYRLYDYGRRDRGGELRELHLDKALEVLTLAPGQRAKVPPQVLSDSVTRLVAAPQFVMERWEMRRTIRQKTDGETLELWTVLSGELTLTAGESRLELTRAASVVLPAQLGAYQWAGEGTLLRCYLP